MVVLYYHFLEIYFHLDGPNYVENLHVKNSQKCPVPSANINKNPYNVKHCDKKISGMMPLPINNVHPPTSLCYVCF